MAVLFFIWGFINYDSLESQINEQVKAYGLISLFILSFLLDIVPQYLSPHIGLFSGALFGFNPVHSLLIIIIGSTLGSVLGFEIGRLFVARANRDTFGYDAFKIKEIMDRKGKWFVAIAAVSPLPYIPLILGMLNMGRKNFPMFGIIPRIIGHIITAFFAYEVFVLLL